MLEILFFQKTRSMLMTQKFLNCIILLVFCLCILLNLPDEAFAQGYTPSAINGGSGGSPFSDDLTQAEQIVKIDIWHGKPSLWFRSSRILAIQTTWSTLQETSFTGCKHGKDRGKLDTIKFMDGEYITEINGRSAKEIDSLKFKTNFGREFGPYGGNGGNPFSLTDLHVGGFFGRSDNRIDAIAVFNSAEN